MSSVRSLQISRSLLVAAAVTALVALGVAPNAFAVSDDNRPPVILDTIGGVNNGRSGTVLLNSPAEPQPIVAAPPIAAPVELPPESSPPFVVAPYIQLPAGGGGLPRPIPRPVPLPQ
jgi:hypothetical protein